MLTRRATLHLALAGLVPDELTRAQPLDGNVTTLTRVQESLVKKGYVTEVRFAAKPLRVKGQSAVALVIGDAHNRPGNAFTAQAIRDLKQLVRLDTLMVEGLCFSPEKQKEEQKLADAYHARIRSRVMTAQERAKAGMESNAPRSGTYHAVRYEAEAGLPKVVGLEDELARFEYYLDARSLLIDLVRYVEANGELLVRCDRKYGEEPMARLFEALAQLRRLHGKDAPTLQESQLVSRRHVTDRGDSFTLDYLLPNTPGLNESLVRSDELFLQEVLGPRNAIAAKNTLNGFRQKDAASMAAVVYGRWHLRPNPRRVPTYPEALQAQGVSTLTLFPGKGQPSTNVK